MTLQYIFIGCQVLALARLLYLDSPYRWFLLALALGIGQSVNVALATESAEWTRTWWRYPEIALVLATSAAVVESIERGKRYVTSYRGHLLRMASVAIPLCIVLAGAYFVAPLSGDTQDKFNQVRAWVWAYLALSMVVVELLLAMEPNVSREPYVTAHSRLLMAVMLAHAIIAPLVNRLGEDWLTARVGYRVAIIACCMGWIWLGDSGE